MTITGYRVTPVVAVVDPEFVPVPQPSEVAEVFEVPLDYLMAPDEACARSKSIIAAASATSLVWLARPASLGVRAILYNLRRRLEQVQ